MKGKPVFKKKLLNELRIFIDELKFLLRKAMDTPLGVYVKAVGSFIFSYAILISLALVVGAVVLISFGISYFIFYPMLSPLFSIGKLGELVGAILFFIAMSIVITLILWPFWGRKKRNKIRIDKNSNP